MLGNFKCTFLRPSAFEVYSTSRYLGELKVINICLRNKNMNIYVADFGGPYWLENLWRCLQTENDFSSLRRLVAAVIVGWASVSIGIRESDGLEHTDWLYLRDNPQRLDIQGPFPRMIPSPRTEVSWLVEMVVSASRKVLITILGSGSILWKLV